MQFGISTHLYQKHRLSRDHLAEIAAHGFEAIELFAARSHFDYHDTRAISELRTWLDDLGLALHSIHAPVSDNTVGDRTTRSYSNASGDAARRKQAVQETAVALQIARTIPAAVLVVHLGVPAAGSESGDNRRDAVLSSLQDLEAMASQAGVRLALEVIPNELSDPVSLVRLLEEELETAHAGICLDFGHAFLMGDLLDAVETVSGHLITTHVHDNRGTGDDHLVPFDGSIDWESALLALRKIGYEGTLLFEPAESGRAAAVLQKAQSARKRFERMLT